MKHIKKLSILFFALLSCHLSMAKDVIVTKQSEKIDAKIIEVSDEEIRYKKQGNLNGPTFVIKTKDISTIVYESGDIQTFKENQVPEVSQEVISPQETSAKEPLQKQSTVTLYPITAGWEMNGRALSRSELEVHLKENCVTAYNQWRKGRERTAAGTTCLIFGSAFTLSGIICLTAYDGRRDGLLVWGVTGAIMGPSCYIASIPFYVSGGVSRRKAIDTYNEKCAIQQGSALQLNFNINNNGLGLALKF